MFEQFLMVSQSGLPVSCTAAHIGLHLLHALHPGLHHLGLVHHIAIKAEALQGAGASFPCGSWARAVLHLLLGDAVSQQLVVVVVDHLPHVGACEVGDFEVAPMGTFLGKHLSINARNFAPSDIDIDIDREGWVPPDDLALPLPLYIHPSIPSDRVPLIVASWHPGWEEMENLRGNLRGNNS